MAIKVLGPVGTDRGITNELYVRISDYQISKVNMAAQFQLQLFVSQEEAAKQSGNFTPFGGTAKNLVIGDSFMVPLTKDNEVVTVSKRPMPSADGGIVEEEVKVTNIIKEFDPSIVAGKDIFDFGYAKLKDHLAAIFPDATLESC